MALQPIRRTASHIAMQPGELLPQPFHPYLASYTKMQGGYFLLRYSAFTNSFPLRNMVLYVARTFLSPHIDEQRQTDLLHSAKVV